MVIEMSGRFKFACAKSSGGTIFGQNPNQLAALFARRQLIYQAYMRHQSTSLNWESAQISEILRTAREDFRSTEQEECRLQSSFKHHASANTDRATPGHIKL